MLTAVPDPYSQESNYYFKGAVYPGLLHSCRIHSIIRARWSKHEHRWSHCIGHIELELTVGAIFIYTAAISGPATRNCVCMHSKHVLHFLACGM